MADSYFTMNSLNLLLYTDITVFFYQQLIGVPRLLQVLVEPEDPFVRHVTSVCTIQARTQTACTILAIM